MKISSDLHVRSGRPAATRRNQQGVALIVVLGFLSIMIIMALAFLTQARVERQVASATLEAMRGRQILRTALNAAMNDYSVELAAHQLVMPPVNTDYDMFTSIPPKPIMGMGGRTIGQDNIELLVGAVEDWIPRKYFNPPYNAKTRVPANAEWILVRDDPSSSQPSRILGRYAYVCFDMSGGVDGNLVARESEVAGQDARVASNRIRRSVRQMPMGLLPEAVNPSQFKSYRRGWKGFDSLQTLIKLTDGKAQDGNDGHTRWQPERKEIFGAGLASNLVSDVVPFSLSVYRGGRYSRSSATWSKPEFCGAAPWTTVLSPIQSQFAPGWQAWVSNAIMDFTSSSPYPIGTDYPSPKNVPMFNEINMSYRLLTPEQDPVSGWYKYTVEVTLTVEFWYPFPSEDNVRSGTYNMPPPTLTGGAAAGDGQIWMQMVMPTVAPPLVAFDPSAAPPAALSVEAKYNNGRPYLATGTTNFVYKMPLIRPVPPSPAPPDYNPAYPFPNNVSPLLVNMVQVRKPIYLRAGTNNVDMIPPGLTIQPVAANVMPGAPVTKVYVQEVTDPRLNHIPGQWVLQGAPSLEARNTWGGSTLNKFMAEGTNLYCRNAPMETPADLGYISTGKEWETIDICTPAAADVLANLIADPNLYATFSSNKVFYTNGTINPNTRSSNVLACAFYDLATQETPNTKTEVVGANPLDEATARLLAQSIMDSTVSGTIDNACQAGSDWVRCAAMQQGGALAAIPLNNNQRESLVRNTWGLFSPDNSLFTVVVVAQTIKEGPNNVGTWNAADDVITGERRAVALVWRDPYKNGVNPHHEMLVRMFRYLND